MMRRNFLIPLTSLIRRAKFRSHGLKSFMLYQIISLLLQVVDRPRGWRLLLRLYMQYQRIANVGPLGQSAGAFVFALTDWLVLPLRRVMPAVGRWDTASLVAAFCWSCCSSPSAVVAGGAGAGLAVLPILALFGLAALALIRA
jgi:YggT family protein